MKQKEDNIYIKATGGAAILLAGFALIGVVTSMLYIFNLFKGIKL